MDSPVGRDLGARTAWIAGAVGRLGDALVEQVVARGYGRVCLLGDRPMPATVRGFEVADLEALQTRSAARCCDDLFLVFDPHPPAPLPHRSRTAPPFLALSTAEETVAVASAAAAAGASRLVLLAPLLAWQQLSAATRLLPEGLETALAATSIATVIVVKPTREEAIRSREGSAVQRFVRFYLSQLRFMLPASAQVIRSSDLARVAVDTLIGSDAPGLRVVGLSAIEAAVAEHRSAAAERPRRR